MVVSSIDQPLVASELCVHSLLETAQCRDCVDHCPRQAWVLSDDSLGLDVEACDGCGVCLPACKQGAIQQNWAVLLQGWCRRGAVHCSCEWAEGSNHTRCLPCVHAISIRQLLGLYAKGMRRLETATADCSGCPRGGAYPLWERVARMNAALYHAGLEIVEVQKRFVHRRDSAAGRNEPAGTGLSKSRRHFLRALIADDDEGEVRPNAAILDGDLESTPPGQLLPTSVTPVPWPHLPSIDPGRCTGCDACARLCPHGAMVLSDADGRLSYQIAPVNCTGCAICMDVCTQDAVELAQWSDQTQYEVPLSAGSCTACGVSFHIPTNPAGSTGQLCQICANRNHHRKLFQVQD